MRPPRSHAGFSLVDVLIAVIIFGILSTIVLAALKNIRRDGTRREAGGFGRFVTSFDKSP
jgi:prepilin-type N-terminal cleavage/methylation domain-containing protein